MVMLAACGDEGGSEKASAVSDGSEDTGVDSEDTGHDGSVPDEVAFPKPEEWYGSDGIMAAIESGEVTEGQAALYLLQIMFGDLDEVPSDLLTSASGSGSDPAHGFIPRVISQLDDLPADEAEAIRTYLEETTGLTLPGEKSPSDLAPYGAAEWCRHSRSAGGCVDIVMPKRPACERDAEGRLVRDSSGAWVPSGCTHMRWPGHEETWQCSSEEATLRPNALALLPAVQEAVNGGYALINAGLGRTCSTGEVQLRVLDTSTAYWAVESIYGTAFPTTSESVDCSVFVTATPPVPAEGPWQTTEDRVRGTVVHELFHCGQYDLGHASTADWMREGTAVWAEDVVGRSLWPGVDTEHHYFNDYFELGRFLDRAYDALFPLAYLGGAELGYDLTKASDPLAELVGLDGFESEWHAASVATWNRAPVEPFLDDERAIDGTSSPDSSGLLPVEQIEIYTPDDIAPLSYQTARYDVDSSVEIVTIRSVLSSEIMATAILEGGGHERVEDLSPGVALRVCQKAVGACHEEDPADLDAVTSIGLVSTNVDHESAHGGSIELDTWAPRLHGQWLTTSLWSTANPAIIAQSGGILSIDEEASPDTFDEALAGVTVYGGMGLDCATTGDVSGSIITEYTGTEEDTAWGTLESSTTSSDAAFECTDSSGLGTFSGGTPGLWIIAAAGSPWSPVEFQLSGDELSLTSASIEGVYWQMNLTRISDSP